jgi:hypothetical protein
MIGSATWLVIINRPLSRTGGRARMYFAYIGAMGDPSAALDCQPGVIVAGADRRGRPISLTYRTTRSERM